MTWAFTFWFHTEPKDLLRKRQVPNRKPVQYEPIDILYQKECKKAKERWLQEEADEVKNLSCNPKEMFQRIREITSQQSFSSKNCIKAADTAFSTRPRMPEYVQELFDGEHEPQDLVMEAIKSGPPILKSEGRWSLQQMQSGNAPSPKRKVLFLSGTS